MTVEQAGTPPNEMIIAETLNGRKWWMNEVLCFASRI
jgi:hypothetical protein